MEGMIASFADSDLKIGGLILDPKSDFLEKVRFVCRRYGREDSLVVLDPSAWAEAAGTCDSIALNFLDNQDDSLEVSSRAIAALRLAGLEQGHEGSYFLD